MKEKLLQEHKQAYSNRNPYSLTEPSKQPFLLEPSKESLITEPFNRALRGTRFCVVTAHAPRPELHQTLSASSPLSAGLGWDLGLRVEGLGLRF